MRYGSLFSGVGGLDLAVEEVTGAEPAWFCEVEPGPAEVLEKRWPGVPNLGDVSVVDWSTAPPVDVLCGGFPCQDISLAGKGAGIEEGTRSGLWTCYADAVRQLRPRYVFVENVAALVVRGLGRVVGDLAGLGFVAEWGCLPASAVGAPHKRNRLFLVAADTGRDARPQHHQRQAGRQPAPHRDHAARRGVADGWETSPYAAAAARWADIIGRPVPDPTDDRGRLNPALAEWMMGWPEGWVTDLLGRTPALKAIGNGVCPQQASAAYGELLERLAK